MSNLSGDVHYDLFLIGAGFRGTDLVTLVIVLPLLVFAIRSYGRGSLRGGILLTGVMSYFLYNAASMAFGAAYNNLLLVYVAMLSSSLSALILAMMAVNPHKLRDSVSETFSRRAIGRFLIFAGIVLTLVWLSSIIPALLLNVAPKELAHYTTIVTYPLDLGIIAPYVILTGVLVLKRIPYGYLFAAPMLVLCTLIGIVILVQTLFQVSAGVPLTVMGIVIFSISFMTMALVAGWLALSYFRSIPDTVPAQSQIA